MSRPDPGSWGVAPGHHHVNGTWVPATDAGIDAALEAMGAHDSAPPETSTWVVRQDEQVQVPFPARLITEDGGEERLDDRIAPSSLPLGYHTIEALDGARHPIRLIVSPGICPLPERGWGWAVQLYATRSRSSWGIGDLADLARLGRWSQAELGASLLLINPLHAVAPNPAQQSSPYYPSSRRWRSPLYLRVEDVPGAQEAGVAGFAASGRLLNDDARIDRDAVWRLKRAALEAVWEGQRPGPAPFVRWAAEQGESLAGFATWCALADVHGANWHEWPLELRRPGSAAVVRFAADHGDALAFHSWLQWLIEGQLEAAASSGPALVTDLAIGADPGGADAWQWQDVLAPGVTVGAPPDEFSPEGQDWGLPPFDPWRLRACGYAPFAEILRASMASGGGVRIDHVAGLFRLFWIPGGSGPRHGVYVRYPWQDMLRVVALEAARAGAFVVGEDLGTVEPEARQALADHNVLSYRLLWFEEQPPTQWPEKALAAVTTHDLPTVRGVWTGADLAARRSLGLSVDEEAERRLSDTLRRTAGGDDDLSVEEVSVRAHRALAGAPSLLVAATLDDAVGAELRPNQPGTVDEWPNWSIPLPLALEDLERDPAVRAVAAAAGEGRGGPSPD